MQKKNYDYATYVEELQSTYKVMWCNMLLNMHFFPSHVGLFIENLGVVSDEHREQFHQDISQFKRRFSGKWNANSLVEYYWSMM